MKKFLKGLLLVIAVFIFAGITVSYAAMKTCTACGKRFAGVSSLCSDCSKPAHKHNYLIPATCVSGAKCSCGATSGATNPSNHSLRWKSRNDNQHLLVCDLCGGAPGNQFRDHEGGSSTCIKRAICSTCGASYGGIDQNKHNYNDNTWYGENGQHFKKCANGCGYKYEIGDHNNFKWEKNATGHAKKCGTCELTLSWEAHSWIEQTCQNPKYCSVKECGYEEGEIGQHAYIWKNDESGHYEQCKYEGCSMIRNNRVYPHSWVKATCTMPKHCSSEYCGRTEGEKVPHNLKFKHDSTCHWMGCNKCDYVIGKVNHIFTSEATCTTAKVCQTKNCGYVADKAKGHKLVEATCTEGAHCEWCGTSMGAPAKKHEWKEATCVSPKKCRRPGCGAIDGKARNHTAPTVNGKCERCGYIFNSITYAIKLESTKEIAEKYVDRVLIEFDRQPDNLNDVKIDWTSSNSTVATIKEIRLNEKYQVAKAGEKVCYIVGEISGLKVGTTDIIAKLENLQEAKVVVTVKKQTIKLSETQKNLAVNTESTINFNFAIKPWDLSRVNTTLTSNNQNIVTVKENRTVNDVSDKTGIHSVGNIDVNVKALSVGTATITASLSTGEVATCEVMVSGIASNDKKIPKIGKITEVQYTNIVGGKEVEIVASDITAAEGSELAKIGLSYNFLPKDSTEWKGWKAVGLYDNTASSYIFKFLVTEEGRYRIAVRAYDKAGNGSDDSTNEGKTDIYVDRTVPVIGNITGVQNTNTASGKEVEIVASNITDAGESGLAKIGLSYNFLPKGSTEWKGWKAVGLYDNTASSYIFKFPVAEEGRYRIAVRAYDKAGNGSDDSTNEGKTDIYVDRTVSVIGSITGVQNTNTASGGKVAVTASGIKDEGGSGLARISWHYKIPGTSEDVVQPWTANTSATNTYNIPITVEGTYNVTVYVQDKAGNTSKGKSTTIVVNRSSDSTDKTVPVIGSITGVQNTNTASGGKVAVTASRIKDEGGSGLARISWHYKIPGTSEDVVQPWTANTSATNTYNIPITVEGTYNVTVYVQDKAGNTSKGKSTTIVVNRSSDSTDKTVPVIGSITGVQNTNTASGGKVAVTASRIKDEGGSGLARISWHYKIPGTSEDVVQPWTANTSTTNTYNIPITVEGTYNVTVYVQDKAGNTSKGKSTTIVVNRSSDSTDKTVPVIGSITGVQNTNTASGGKVAVTASGIKDEGGSGLARISWRYKIPGTSENVVQPWTTNTSLTNTYNVPITVEGTYNVVVYVQDKAGNISKGKSTTIVVSR